MKMFAILLALFAYTSCAAVDHNAVLHVTLDNAKSPVCRVWVPGEFKNNSFGIPLAPGKAGEHIFKLDKPGFVTLFCSGAINISAIYFIYRPAITLR